MIFHETPSYSDSAPAFKQQSSGIWNRQLILRLLSGEGPLSRRHISQRTGIQDSAVTYIVRDLVAGKLVRSAGKQPGTGAGRRHLLLEINPDYGFTVGASLLHNGAVDLVLLNSAQEVVDHVTLPIETSARTFPGELRRVVKEWLNGRGRPPGKCLGLAIGLPGVVDVKRKMVMRSWRFAWSDYPLGRLLEDEFRAPILVDYSASLSAYAEKRLGCAQNLSHFLNFMMNRALDRNGRPYYSFGTSLFLEGKVYMGAHFAAGELDAALTPDIELTIEEGDALATSLADEGGGMTPLLARIAKQLAVYLAPISNLLDPQAVLLSGEGRIRNRSFLEMLEDRLQGRLIPVGSRRVRVLASELGERAVACGAALRINETSLFSTELVSYAMRGRRAG